MADAFGTGIEAPPDETPSDADIGLYSAELEAIRATS